MIKVIVHRDPNGLVKETNIADLSEIITQDDRVVWVDVTDPTPAEVERIGKEFGFHPLALEDTLTKDIRPKIDQYDGYQFIVFYGLTREGETCLTHQADIFVGKNYMVTFHDSKLRVVAETAERWQAERRLVGSSRHRLPPLLPSRLAGRRLFSSPRRHFRERGKPGGDDSGRGSARAAGGHSANCAATC